MKSLKENFLVKTSCSYIDLIYKLYPLVILFFLVQSIASIMVISSGGNIYSPFVDFFNLFGAIDLKTGHKPTVVIISIIFVCNLSIVVVIYLGIKKLYNFFKNVLEDKPFAEENGKYLKFIGILIIAISTMVHVSKVLSFYFGSASTVIGTIEQVLFVSAGILSIVFNPFFILGIFVFVFGEIIIRATKMKEEIDLTV